MKSYKNKNNDKEDKKKSIKNSDKIFDPAQASEQKIENPEKEKEEEIEKNKYFEKEYLKIREQVRYNPFQLPFEQLDKNKAYLQFLLINDYLMYKNLHQPFEWLDENIEQKLIEAVKNADKDAELMADHIWWKATSFCDCHPETMPLYVEVLKWGDYKWQMLNRLLLIYQRYKNEIDDKTMNWYHNVFEQMEEENIKTYFN